MPTIAQLTSPQQLELVRAFQREHGLAVDGVIGPKTLAALQAALAPAPASRPPAASARDALAVVSGVLVGPRVTVMLAHPTWFGGVLVGGAPKGIVAHVSATNAGTALAMARRRARKFGEDPNDRLASWHVSIEAGGSIVQMVRLTQVAHHAGSDTAKPVPGLGWANHTTVGIEMIGWEHGPFPEAQVASACAVWRAIVAAYGIKREHALITHSSIDPKRRSDPGAVFMASCAPRILASVYS